MWGYFIDDRIPAHTKLRQEDHTFKISLGHIATSRPTCVALPDPVPHHPTPPHKKFQDEDVAQLVGICPAPTDLWFDAKPHKPSLVLYAIF